MIRDRRQTGQTIAWFRDLHSRDLLELDPPYQRRSVWNQTYKDYFIETILLQYPAPAIFLYENITADGVASYSVVDGKQRLSAIFEFVGNLFPVSEKCPIVRLRGRYFEQLSEEERKSFWTYQFVVEYLPTTDESTLNNIFDRINRNVARLTPQELRHARFAGAFATAAENLTEEMQAALPPDLPRFAAQSKRQMKDVELVSQLLLLIESGVNSYSQAELDEAYSVRDTEWEAQLTVEQQYRSAIMYLSRISVELLNGVGRRLRNQADFYSLFGAIVQLSEQGRLPALDVVETRLREFFAVVLDDNARANDKRANDYYEAARSASNDVGPRTTRISIMSQVLAGE